MDKLSRPGFGTGNLSWVPGVQPMKGREFFYEVSFMELTKQHISEERLQWLIDGLDLKAWILGPKAQDCFEKALLELKQRRAEDRKREAENASIYA